MKRSPFAALSMSLFIVAMFLWAFVAARIAWTGAGINLATSRPSPKEVSNAVREVLNCATYRTKARALQSDFAQYNALERISCYVDSLLGYGSGADTACAHSNA
jgi:hypothetical protein